MTTRRIWPQPVTERRSLHQLGFVRFALPLLFLVPVNDVPAQETNSTAAADAEFWESVYSKNHVLDVQITVTDENWQAMQPAQGQGGRGGGPPNRGRGGRPDGGRQRGGRPDGPPPGGGADGGRPPREDGTPPEGDRNRQSGPQRGGRRGGPPGGGGPGGGGPGGGGPGGGPGGASDFTFVKAQLVVDGQNYTDIGLRFKGNSSYRMAANSLKRPMKIDTNKYIKGQKLHGRDKLNFSNAVFDSAFMKEKLGYELYKSAGLATPGVGWANVTLIVGNRKTPLGIYVVIEQVDKRYLESHFGADSKDSLLMKPEAGQWSYLGNKAEDYAGYDIKYGETNDKLFQQFGELMKLIESGSDSEFESQIGDRFDLPSLAGYLAATSLLSSLDSYVGSPHNYYLMLNKADGKLRLLPWDVNESFAANTQGASLDDLVNWDIDRPWTTSRRLLERLFKTETFPKLYRASLTNLTKEFTEEALSSRIDGYRKAIAPHVDKYKSGPGTKGLNAGIDGDQDGINRSVDRQVLAIRPFIKRRHESVSQQLAGKRNGQTISGRRGR